MRIIEEDVEENNQMEREPELQSIAEDRRHNLQFVFNLIQTNLTSLNAALAGMISGALLTMVYTAPIVHPENSSSSSDIYSKDASGAIAIGAGVGAVIGCLLVQSPMIYRYATAKCSAGRNYLRTANNNATTLNQIPLIPIANPSQR